MAVDVVSVSVCIPREVQPLNGHPLAVVRGAEERVDARLVSIRGPIRQKGIDFRRRWRQACKIKGHSPQQCSAVGFGRWLESFFLEPRQNKIIDGVMRPSRGSDRGRVDSNGSHIGPMLLPFRALIYPAPDQSLLVVAKPPPRVRRRPP